MLLSLVPLLLLVSSSQASHFLGTMMTYYPEETSADGSVSVILRYKLSFVSCGHSDSWQCGGNCGTQSNTLSLSTVEEVSGEWCQREGAITHLLPNNTEFESVLAGGDWINGIQNGIISWRAVTDVELRNRSDTKKPNTSPQTTILPALRIPSNCPKTISLLAFDPDGDEVRCRFGNTLDSECNPCTPPSDLSLSSSCSLLFSPTNSTSEIPYAVQLVMEDFPPQTIVLTQTDGSQEVKNVSAAISKIPLQFVLKVGPTVPSCVEGDYLPRFLSPTPDNRAQLYAPVGQALEIPIRAEAMLSDITGFLFSGPHNVIKGSSGLGNFSLTWTPTASEDGQSHPVCFVVQASFSNTSLNSDLRCVIVTVVNSPIMSTSSATTTASATTQLSTAVNVAALTPTVNITVTPVTFPPTTSTTNTTHIIPNTYAAPANTTTAAPGPEYIIALNMKISTTLSMENDSNTIITLIKRKLVDEGLPDTITLRLLSSNLVVVTTGP